MPQDQSATAASSNESIPLSSVEKAAVHLATTERSGQVINTPIAASWQELLKILEPKKLFKSLDKSGIMEAFKLAKNLITELSKEEKIDKKLRNSIQRSGKTVLPETSPSGIWVGGVYGQLRRQLGPYQHTTTRRSRRNGNSNTNRLATAETEPRSRNSNADPTRISGNNSWEEARQNYIARLLQGEIDGTLDREDAAVLAVVRSRMRR